MIQVMCTGENTNVLSRNKPGYGAFTLRMFEQVFKTVMLLTVIGVSFQTPPTAAEYKNIEVRTTQAWTVQLGRLSFIHLLQLHMSVENCRITKKKCILTMIGRSLRHKVLQIYATHPSAFHFLFVNRAQSSAVLRLYFLAGFCIGRFLS